MALHDPDGFLKGEWSPVTSSNVAAAMYDPEGGNLHVAFTSGHAGFYSGVPEGIAIEFAHAPSSGKYLHHVLKRLYPWVRG